MESLNLPILCFALPVVIPKAFGPRLLRQATPMSWDESVKHHEALKADDAT